MVATAEASSEPREVEALASIVTVEEAAAMTPSRVASAVAKVVLVAVAWEEMPPRFAVAIPIGPSRSTSN